MSNPTKRSRLLIAILPSHLLTQVNSIPINCHQRNSIPKLSIAGFQNSIGSLDVKSSTTSFYVQLGKDFSEARSPIPFAKELLNVGGAYNRTSRKFTAPVTGKYFFTVTGVVAFPANMSNISFLQLALYKNGGEIGRAFSDEMTDIRKHGTISLQSTLDLTKGDQIWPMISFIAPAVYLVGHGYTHYSGFLLDEDIM